MPTTVKDLIEELQKFPGDFPVILASDEEGNDYQHVSDVGSAVHFDEGRTVSVVGWMSDIADDDDDTDYFTHDEPIPSDRHTAVVIWP